MQLGGFRERERDRRYNLCHVGRVCDRHQIDWIFEFGSRVRIMFRMGVCVCLCQFVEENFCRSKYQSSFAKASRYDKETIVVNPLATKITHKAHVWLQC